MDISGIFHSFFPMLNIQFLQPYFKNVRYLWYFGSMQLISSNGHAKICFVDEWRRNAEMNGFHQRCCRKPHSNKRLRVTAGFNGDEYDVGYSSRYKPSTWQWFIGGRHLDQWPGLSAIHPATGIGTIRFWRRMNKTFRYRTIDPSRMDGVYISSC